MRHETLVAVVAIVTVASIVPAVAADHAGHTYEFDEEIEVEYPGAYARYDAHDYRAYFVEPGAEITATLIWPEDPTKDMSVEINGPGDSCTGSPDIGCNVDLLTGLPGRADCGEAPDPSPGSGTSETVTRTVREGGEWTVTVGATLAQPADSLPYELSITVDGEHGDVGGPAWQGYIDTTGHCNV